MDSHTNTRESALPRVNRGNPKRALLQRTRVHCPLRAKRVECGAEQGNGIYRSLPWLPASACHSVAARAPDTLCLCAQTKQLWWPQITDTFLPPLPPRAFGDPESSLSPPPFPHPRVHPAPSCCVAWAQIPGAKFPELGELSTKMPEAEAPTARVPAAPAQAAARTFPGAVSAEPAVARSRVLGLGALLGLRVRGKPCCSRASSGRKLSEEP